MPDTRRISGHATLQCNSNASHKWEEGYSVHSDEHGNPNMAQLNIFLKRRKVRCPECDCISFKIIGVTISTVHI